MFSQIKTWAIGLLSAISVGLFAWLKIKQNKTEKLEKQNQALDAQVKAHEISDESRDNLKEREEKIEEKFNEKKSKADSDKPLSPSLRKLLNDSGAANPDKTSE